jgi:crotonobetainyl-CoA:carnitine CoA-transferase CaiB-like acyl-CoA transferase
MTASPSPLFSNTRPLAGITVLDMSQGIAGPSCGGYFAEHGARVIKIEPPEGDWMRHLGTRIDGMSSQTIAYNRGKESLAIDLRKPEGRDVALKFAERADVAIESARPGVFERLGLGFEALKARNPDIIYVSVSGWGQRGPNREWPMVDTIGQAVSGFMSATRSREGAPVKVDVPFIDAFTGLYAFQAASMALWGKAKGSGARHIDISLLQSAAHAQSPNILEYGFVGRPPGLLNPPAGNYRTQDGWIAITLVNQAQFEGICRAIGRPEAITDARFTTVQGRKENVAALRVILDDALLTRTTDEWVPIFTREGALASRINTYGDWLDDPHVRAIDAAPAYALESGRTVPLPHLPGQAAFDAPVPVIGQHTRALLAEAGMGGDAIDKLIVTKLALQANEER